MASPRRGPIRVTLSDFVYAAPPHYCFTFVALSLHMFVEAMFVRISHRFWEQNELIFLQKYGNCIRDQQSGNCFREQKSGNFIRGQKSGSCLRLHTRRPPGLIT